MILQTINPFVRGLHTLYSAPKQLANRLHYQKHRNPTAPKIWNQEKRAFWEENGYVVLEGLYDYSQIQRVNHCMDEIWSKRRIPDPRLSVDVYIGSKHERRAYIDQVEAEARQQPFKLNDLFLVSNEALALSLGDALTAILADILRDIPIVCNTLNLEYGSQQDYHTDTLYMPASSGVCGSTYHCNMVASWIALEDCHKDAGLLQYYPKSHKISPFYFSNGKLAAEVGEIQNYEEYMANEVRRHGLKPKTFEAKQGDVVIWHELLFHGGSEIVDPRKTRKSLVTHYFRASDVAVKDRQPFAKGYYLNREPHKPPV